MRAPCASTSVTVRRPLGGAERMTRCDARIGLGMTILLAFLSAIVYGVADYAGGRATRSATSPVVALIGQAGEPRADRRRPRRRRGPGSRSARPSRGARPAASRARSVCTAFYFALANGAMTVVAPLTAVVGASLPVAVGVATGERPRPIAFVGIACAVLAVALVSGALHGRERPTPARVVVTAILAGVGFGGLFVCFDRAADDSGVWPLLAARSASIPLLALLVAATLRSASPGARRSRRVDRSRTTCARDRARRVRCRSCST